MKTPLLIAAIFLTTHLLPVTASPSPSTSSTYLAQADDGGNSNTPQEVQAQAQKITVRITSTDNGGSGVLIAKKGTTYLVLTNQHVVGKTAKFQIQTPDGQKHAAQLVPNTQIDPKYDAVLLQFTSRQTYTLANLKYDTGTPLTEGREIYSAGFPFDSERLRFTIGAVTQLSDVPLEDGTQIGYITNPGQKGIRQGMSGGPVLDGNGTVIGINTIGAAPILPSYTYFDGSKPLPIKATEYAKANWGVPIYNVLTQLNPDILYNYENLPKVQRQVTPQGYMAELNRKARKMTVRIETGGGNDTDTIAAMKGTGSGVIVAKEGNTYYVLTAKHVVWNSDNKSFHSTNIKTITDDQQSYTVQPSDITLAEGQDLAVVKFTSNTNHSVATLGDYKYILLVFVGGYPRRDRIDSPLWQWQLNMGWNDLAAKSEIQNRTSFSEGYNLRYSSISFTGMSGGPVFDHRGSVVGIHGKVEGDSEFNSTNNDLSFGLSLGINIRNFIRISDKLKVNHKLLKINKIYPEFKDKEFLSLILSSKKLFSPQVESSGQQWLQYGNQLYRNHRYTEAARAFDTAITKDKEYQLLGNYGKALSLFADRKHTLAQSAIALAISATPVSVDRRKNYYYLWKYQSDILFELEKYEEANRAIDIAIDLEPSDKILRDKKGFILIKKKKYPEAIAIYNKLIRSESEPDLYKSYLYRSQLYTSRGIAKSDSGDKQGAILDYNQAIAINPFNVTSYINRGIAKSDSGDNQGAILDYNQAISIDPKLSEAYTSRGVAKFKLGDNQSAILDHDRAIAINPNLAEAYTSRGVAKSDLGDNQSAILDQDRAIAINPNYALAYYNRAVIKSKLGNKQGAVVDLKRAAELFRQQGNIDEYQSAINLVKKIEE